MCTYTLASSVNEAKELLIKGWRTRFVGVLLPPDDFSSSRPPEDAAEEPRQSPRALTDLAGEGGRGGRGGQARRVGRAERSQDRSGGFFSFRRPTLRFDALHAV